MTSPITEQAYGGASAAPGPAPRPNVRCRKVVRDDAGALASLLARGFPERGEAAWRSAVERLLAWTETGDLPGAGYVLDAGGDLVGVLLTVFGPDGRRCNLSSWYADEAYRRYASMLVNVATRDRAVTYLNVSSRRHTRPIIEAQGFRRYADGVMLALPLLAGRSPAAVSVLRGDPPAGVAVDPQDLALVATHAAMGCITLWCVVAGRAQPFVFARRRILGRLSVAQVVYCPAGTDWRAVAPAIGRALLRERLLVLLLDAEGPVPGLTGRFLPGRMPKYARGPDAPRCGDLSYTECSLLGT